MQIDAESLKTSRQSPCTAAAVASTPSGSSSVVSIAEICAYIAATAAGSGICIRGVKTGAHSSRSRPSSAVSASAVTLGAHIEIGMLVEHASAESVERRMGQREAVKSQLIA